MRSWAGLYKCQFNCNLRPILSLFVSQIHYTFRSDIVIFVQKSNFFHTLTFFAFFTETFFRLYSEPSNLFLLKFRHSNHIDFDARRGGNFFADFTVFSPIFNFLICVKNLLLIPKKSEWQKKYCRQFYLSFCQCCRQSTNMASFSGW
jgi:hypothetical protein